MNFKYTDTNNNQLQLSQEIINFIQNQISIGVIFIPTLKLRKQLTNANIDRITFKKSRVVECDFEYKINEKKDWIYFNIL